jgi:hypothetical protein
MVGMLMLWSIVTPARAQNVIAMNCPNLVAAGGTASCVVTLSLTAGVSVDTVTFGAAATPNGGAPALTSGQVSFAANVGSPLVSAGGTNNAVSALWVNLSPAFSSFTQLGSLSFTVPAAAAVGQSYSVTIPGAGASLANATIPLSIAAAPTVSVGKPCDVGGGATATVSDLQEIINEALGLALPVNDVYHDGVVNAVDVQAVANAVLGLGCPAM